MKKLTKSKVKPVKKVLKQMEDLAADILDVLKKMEDSNRKREEGRQARQAALPKFDVLGPFVINSGKLRITDPCHDKGTRCAGVEPAVKGTWTGAIRRDDYGVPADLVVWHSTSSATEALSASDESSINVGVDSGQISFFDDALYPGKDDEFYRQVCDKTLGRDAEDYRKGPNRGGGVFHFGVVSETNSGDGSYTCYVKRDKHGAVVAARIETGHDGAD